MQLTPSQMKRARGPFYDDTEEPRVRSRGLTEAELAARIIQAKKLVMLGATDTQVADFFGISVRQLYKWKNIHQELADAMLEAKEAIDRRVERRLFEKAMGYEFDSEKIMNVNGEIVRVPIREHVPPDNVAMIFWLKNRQGWRDQQDVKLDATVSTPDTVSDRELALAMIARLQRVAHRVEQEQLAASPVVEHDYTEAAE